MEQESLKDVPLQSPESPSSDSEDMYSVASTPISTPRHGVKTRQTDLLQEVTDDDSNHETIKHLMNEKDAIKVELQNVKLDVNNLELEFKQSRDELKCNLLGKLEQLVKSRDAAKKDLESMVIKFAMSEKSVIDAKKAQTTAESKLRDIMRDRDSLLARIKSLTSDKNSLISALDRKLLDHANSVKEVDKLTHELRDTEAKLKQASSKLSTALEAQQDYKEQLKSLNQVLHILKEELETCKINTAALDKQMRDQSSDQDDNCPRSGSATPTRSSAIVESASIGNGIPEIIVTSSEPVRRPSSCEQCPRLDSDVADLRDKLTCATNSLEEERSRTSRLQGELEEVKKCTEKSFQEKSSKIDGLQETIKCLEGELSELRCECEMLRSRENELTDLCENLRDKLTKSQLEHEHCQEKIRSHLETIERKTVELEDEKKRVNQLEENLKEMTSSSQLVKKNYECKIQSMTNQVQSLNSKIEELENDKRIISKKHSNSLKELQKELSIARRKLMDMDAANPTSNHHSDQQQQQQQQHTAPVSSPNCTSGATNATISRSSSSTSMDAVSQANSQSSKDQRSNGFCRIDGESTIEVPNNVLNELDKHKLVERILKLQKILAKRSEKMDFLEDNNHQLVEELKRKTRLIQHYLLREESGALTTNAMDVNKVSKMRSIRMAIDVSSSFQRELLKRGSTVMSSLFKDSMESEMTLELSLEINRKLQAVLEDTILKNITLKVGLTCSFSCKNPEASSYSFSLLFHFRTT